MCQLSTNCQLTAIDEGQSELRFAKHNHCFPAKQATLLEKRFLNKRISRKASKIYFVHDCNILMKFPIQPCLYPIPVFLHQFQTFESKVKLEVGKYAEWVEKVQHMPDPLVDVRVEPKFYIPDGKPYDGGWCRPQTDGPG